MKQRVFIDGNDVAEIYNIQIEKSTEYKQLSTISGEGAYMPQEMFIDVEAVVSEPIPLPKNTARFVFPYTQKSMKCDVILKEISNFSTDMKSPNGFGIEIRALDYEQTIHRENTKKDDTVKSFNIEQI